MKKSLVIALATAMVVGGGSMVMANGLGAGIKGSPHDFSDNAAGGVAGSVDEVSATGWNGRKEICRVCHVPHDHGKDKYLNGLLWNHTVSSASYTMYDNTWSSTLTHTQDSAPTGNSKLCLGCHDGSVAIDTFDKYAGGAQQLGVAGNYDAGAKVPRFMDGANLDLRGTHPLSITYAGDTVGEAGGLKADTTTWTGGQTIASTLQDGKVQCSTCHDVHDSVGVAVASTHLLRAATTGAGTESALCLTCHNK
ncbi:MAG: hypothetical protein COX17_08510 [Deltaproteobacteria bacterium CG23_combo_of_CG06-09_8_20_14_all_60_8]|nr:MAG: hypothetical protein COX17_08510 [Deltaproteobacteria bacterium CG23_combo_of_CG06-09_8_20_14_all_60_8]